MVFVTDFADQAVLLPVMLVVAQCVWMSGWKRGAAAWLVGVGGTLMVTLFLKLAFLSCGSDEALRSPSGHTAAAAVICGGLMTVLAGKPRWAVPTAVLAALLIGGSRLALGAHTSLEVVVGATAGILGAASIALLAGPIHHFQRKRTVAAVAVVLLLLHGMRMPAEAHIRQFARQVAHFIPACHES